jgi:hypothetical protein
MSGWCGCGLTLRMDQASGMVHIQEINPPASSYREVYSPFFFLLHPLPAPLIFPPPNPLTPSSSSCLSSPPLHLFCHVTLCLSLSLPFPPFPSLPSLSLPLSHFHLLAPSHTPTPPLPFCSAPSQTLPKQNSAQHTQLILHPLPRQLHVGDTIVSIDGIQMGRKTLAQAHALLSGNEGTECQLELQGGILLRVPRIQSTSSPSTNPLHSSLPPTSSPPPASPAPLPASSHAVRHSAPAPGVGVSPTFHLHDPHSPAPRPATASYIAAPSTNGTASLHAPPPNSSSLRSVECPGIGISVAESGSGPVITVLSPVGSARWSGKIEKVPPHWFGVWGSDFRAWGLGISNIEKVPPHPHKLPHPETRVCPRRRLVCRLPVVSFVSAFLAMSRPSFPSLHCILEGCCDTARLNPKP